LDSTTSLSKQIGANGQLSFADDELWLYQPEAAARLDRAMAAMGGESQGADLDALERHLGLL
jgi:hypothetical protein